jgi:hypothetical protein
MFDKGRGRRGNSQGRSGRYENQDGAQAVSHSAAIDKKRIHMSLQTGHETMRRPSLSQKPQFV